jgi:hypothetical protein
MFAPDAKQYLGRNIAVFYRDRHGDLRIKSLYVRAIEFVPAYGGCLIGNNEQIWLDTVVSISTID